MAAEETQNKCNEQGTYVFKIKHSYNYKYVLKNIILNWYFSVPTDGCKLLTLPQGW